MESVPWGPHCGVKLALSINFESVLSRQLIGKFSKRILHQHGRIPKVRARNTLIVPDPAIWNEARRNCVFEGKNLRCRDGQEDTQAACSQYAHAFGFLEEADELGHALETWSDATNEYWVKVVRMCQIPLSGKFATFRMKPVLGETFMPLGCVILEGADNAELRVWKAFGQWVNTIRKATPNQSPRTCFVCRQKFCHLHSRWRHTQQEGDGRLELRRAQVCCRRGLVDRPLSLLTRECVSAQCQMLSERVRRLAERALQKGLECNRRATHKWLSQALKGGAGPAHRCCGKEDALPELPLVIRDRQCVAELYAQEMET